MVFSSLFDYPVYNHKIIHCEETRWHTSGAHMRNAMQSLSDFSIIDKAIVGKKRIIVSTRVQNLFVEKIFLISAGIMFFPMNIMNNIRF